MDEMSRRRVIGGVAGFLKVFLVRVSGDRFLISGFLKR